MLYNSLLENFLLPAGDILNGSSVMKQLRFWRSVQHLNEQSMHDMSSKNLSHILRYATNSIPYYKTLKGLTEEKGITSEEWLQRFPIIRKHNIKDDISAFIRPGADKLIVYESSGSSGIQGKVYMNKREQSIIRAILMLWWEWAGYEVGKKVLQTGMTPNRGFLKSCKDLLFRTRYFVAFGLDENIIERELRSVRHQSDIHLCGYASSLYLFAKVAKDKNISRHFDSVISWGDKMFSHYRTTIEEAFETKVFDTYACNEGLMIAAQSDLPYYYIMSPHVFVEIVDKEGKEVPDGQMGHVVITRLDNFSMPLIRYYNGDLAIKLPRDKYPDQRMFQFPLLERVIGRDTDIVRTKSGKFLIVHFFTGIFEFYPTIKQFRVIQYELDGITVEYIQEVNFDAQILNEITNKIHGHLNENFTINYKQVDFIPPTSSGKPQIITSEIPQS